MSTEAANAARFKKGMTVLSPLEGELLEALELMRRDYVVYGDHKSRVAKKSDSAISSAHGETE